MTGMPQPLSATEAEWRRGVEAARRSCQWPSRALVDRVVDDLPEVVHEAPVMVGAGMYMPGRHGPEPPEDREVPRVVVGCVRADVHHMWVNVVCGQRCAWREFWDAFTIDEC